MEDAGDPCGPPVPTPTPRSRVRRKPERASYDEAAVFAILDAGVLGHVGYVVEGQPFVTPTTYWREDFPKPDGLLFSDPVPFWMVSLSGSRKMLPASPRGASTEASPS